MRFARFSEELTKAAHFHDRRSMIGLRFDGTERVVLKGRDKESLREACFERDMNMCVDREMSPCFGWLEMSHFPAMSKSEGSDVLEKVFCRCWRHHILLDGHKQPMHY